MSARRCIATTITTVVLLLASGNSSRAQLSDASVTTTGAICSAANDAEGFCANQVALTTATDTTIASRYAWNINADVAALSTRITSSTAVHNLSFNATAPRGYRLTIAQQLRGGMNRRSDTDGCDGRADISGVTGTSSFTVTSGTLNITDPGVLSTGQGTVSVPFNATNSATIDSCSNGVAQAHSLTFSWTGSVTSSSCEVAVRLGASNETTVNCEGCEYPGLPSRTQATDGHFITVNFAPFVCGDAVVNPCEECDLGSTNGTPGACCTAECTIGNPSATCGNGVVDACEQCDHGAANGGPGSCCTTACTIAAPATVCRTSAGECDVEELCSGSSANCPADTFKSSATVCRASAGACDVAENCTGSSATCPADAKRLIGDGCGSPPSACRLAQECDGINDACPPAATAPAGTVCRAAAGVCDVADVCDGVNTTCPNNVQPSGQVCRASSGACDVAEACNGVSPSCPGNAFAPAGTTCRAATDACDAPEACNGSSTACPADALRPSSFVCRPAAGACDLAESCSGTGTSCPADAKSTAVCRPPAGDCDVAESCTGVGSDCPLDATLPSSTLCRAAAGICDVAEHCDGTSAACPADALASSTTVCRASTTACDPEELCSGSSTECPTDSSNCPCADPASIVKAKIKARQLHTPPGDDKVDLGGNLSVAPVPPIDPRANGVDVILTDANDTVLVDASIPGGTYDPVLQKGWRCNATGTNCRYVNTGRFVPLVGCISNVTIRNSASSPGAVRFAVKGKTCQLPLTADGELPLEATLVLGPTQCGRTQAPPVVCSFNSARSQVVCR